ncbi:hypothetical protein [Marivita sp. GX14005]|uniref:hypothetical protein n=1 Tax=Marivita sp. GX14005 TaxID=2942276 RepID=UPI002019DDF6|nr:hypothetical protein [Marivita sp. GX14005]MCL3881059.1 hypothetical protein [Marivita sp. GX14005]
MPAIPKRALFALALGLCSTPAGAEPQSDKRFSLAAPEKLQGSGFLDYLLPRFSLKTRMAIEMQTTQSAADARFGDAGVAVFEGDGRVWHFDPGPDPDAQRFGEWLRSDIGRRTIEAFSADGAPVFSAVTQRPLAAPKAALDGDAARGERASLALCGRCHVIGEANRMNSIGSTPSFAVLRTLRNWRTRFETFYVQNPHPAFTQIAGLTAPFDPSRPSPIRALEMSLSDLDDILAFVQSVPPADLGRPVQAMRE